MVQKYAMLVRIPSFQDNYVRGGLLASYNNQNGEIFIEKSDLVKDPNPESNIFRKLFKALPIEKFISFEEDRNEKTGEYDILPSDNIKVIEMSEEHFLKENLNTQPLTQLVCLKGEEGLFHVIHLEKSDEIKEQRSFSFGMKSVDDHFKDEMQQQIRMREHKKNTFPILTIQFLSVLLENIKCNSIHTVSSECFFREYLKDFINAEYENEAGEDLGTFKHFSASKMKNKATTKAFKEYEKPGDKLVIFTNDNLDEPLDDGWYVLRKSENQNKKTDAGPKKVENDCVDGEVSSILLKVGETLLSTLILLVSKHIKKYARKQDRRHKLMLEGYSHNDQYVSTKNTRKIFRRMDSEVWTENFQTVEKEPNLKRKIVETEPSKLIFEEKKSKS